MGNVGAGIGENDGYDVVCRSQPPLAAESLTNARSQSFYGGLEAVERERCRQSGLSHCKVETRRRRVGSFDSCPPSPQSCLSRSFMPWKSSGLAARSSCTLSSYAANVSVNARLIDYQSTECIFWWTDGFGVGLPHLLTFCIPHYGQARLKGPMLATATDAP